MSIPQFLLKYCEQKNLKSTDKTKFIFSKFITDVSTCTIFNSDVFYNDSKAVK